MKKTLRWMVSLTVFLLCGLLIFGKISEILRRKVDKYTNMMHVLYHQTGGGGTADVVSVGSSHGYWAFQSNCLWGEYGITGLNMCSPRQSVASSYYVLKEVLKYEKPKVVLLETYYFHNDGKYAEDPEQVHVRKAIDGLRLDEVKHEVIQDFFADMSFEDQLTLYIPFIKYHSRWAELEDYDFNSYYFLRGSTFDFSVTRMEDPGMPTEAVGISDTNYEYLEKMHQLCEENGIQLVVYAAPMGSDGDIERYYEDQGLNLTLEPYLEERGIPFLFFQNMDDISFDFESDFVDARHLNTRGGIKLTTRLGEWLRDECGLADHRGDPDYQSYAEDYADYLELLERAGQTAAGEPL